MVHVNRWATVNNCIPTKCSNKVCVFYYVPTIMYVCVCVWQWQEDSLPVGLKK